LTNKLDNLDTTKKSNENENNLFEHFEKKIIQLKDNKFEMKMKIQTLKCELNNEKEKFIEMKNKFTTINESLMEMEIIKNYNNYNNLGESQNKKQ